MTWKLRMLMETGSQWREINAKTWRLAAYLHAWTLKLNKTETELAIFYFHHKEVKREFEARIDGETLPFCFVLKYLVH